MLNKLRSRLHKLLKRGRKIDVQAQWAEVARIINEGT